MEAKNRKAKYEIDMCNGPILSKMLIFAVPLMCSSILQLLFNAADIVVVGKFVGDNALAAVGSNTSLINLLTNLFIGLSVGANVLVARYYGGKKEENLKKTVHTSMMLSIYSGILLTVIGVVGARQILELMQTPKEVLGLATVYLRIYFLGMTANMVYNFGSAILRAVGDTKRPLYYLFAAGVVNVILNLIFVVGFNMSVAGVGLATVLSECISAFLIIRCMMKEKGAIHLVLHELGIDKAEFIKILKIGLPAGFQGIIFALANVVIQSSINSFGATVVAGNTAAANIEGFVYVAMNSFYQATLSFAGQNMGAKNFKRIDRITVTGELCVVFVGLVLGNLVVFFGDTLLGIYSSSDEVIAAGIFRLKVVSRTYALCGMMDVMVGALRGVGYSVIPMIVSLIGACGLRLLWLATLFQMDRFHNITMIYMTYPVSWVITIIAHVITFLIVRQKIRINV